MKNFDITQKKAFELVDKYCSSDATHQRDHIERVIALIKYLAKQENSSSNFDLELLKLAAVLHDLGQNNQIKKLQKSVDKFRSGEHSKHSLIIARKFLQREGFTREQINKVQKIIASHGTKGRNENLEGDLLHDADLLDGIGLVGTLRKVAYGGQIGRGIVGSLEFTKLKMENRQFRTKTGQKIGQKRIAQVKKFLKEIEKELKNNDLI